eukprot:10843990-Alexandrium_andersonii.AAC.1
MCIRDRARSESGMPARGPWRSACANYAAYGACGRCSCARGAGDGATGGAATGSATPARLVTCAKAVRWTRLA